MLHKSQPESSFLRSLTRVRLPHPFNAAAFVDSISLTCSSGNGSPRIDSFARSNDSSFSGGAPSPWYCRLGVAAQNPILDGVNREGVRAGVQSPRNIVSFLSKNLDDGKREYTSWLGFLAHQAVGHEPRGLGYYSRILILDLPTNPRVSTRGTRAEIMRIEH